MASKEMTEKMQRERRIGGWGWIKKFAGSKYCPRGQKRKKVEKLWATRYKGNEIWEQKIFSLNQKISVQI